MSSVWASGSWVESHAVQTSRENEGLGDKAPAEGKSGQVIMNLAHSPGVLTQSVALQARCNLAHWDRDLWQGRSVVCEGDESLLAVDEAPCASAL